VSIKEKEKYMTDIWTDPQHPTAFTGPEKLYQIIRKEGRFKIGRGTNKKFLEKKNAYSLQIPPRRHFPRSRVIVEGLNEMTDGDLASMEMFLNIKTEYNIYSF
jgi:hypothetical protein